MDLSRFVRITRDGSATNGGTGYLLHSDLVLTARHVVADASELVVHYDGRLGPAEAKVERVAWEGAGDLDVAVLEVKTDRLLAREVLDPRRFRGELRWRSRGWARVAPLPSPASTSVVDAMSALGGRAYEFSVTAERFEVGVDDPPVGVDWWKGASGAPVFSDRGLLGVIAHGDRPFEGGRLAAIPIAALWGAEGFLAAIGNDASWQELRARRREELVDHLTEILTEHRKAAETLAAEDESWRRALLDKEHGGPAGLARALVAAPSWRGVLNAVYCAHQRLLNAGNVGSSAGEAEALGRLLNRALPDVYAASEILQSPFAAGSLVLTLPVESETLAEISMAAIEGRPLDFDAVKGRRDVPRGRAMFSLESLTQPTDFDWKGEGAVREWILYLADWLGMAPKTLQTLGAPERIESLAKLVNHEIERDVRDHLPRRFFLFTPEFQKKHGDFLTELGNRLPALQLAVLAGHELADELIATEPLLNILFHSQQPSR